MSRTQAPPQLSLRHKPPDDTGPCQMQSVTAQTPTRLQLFAQQRVAPVDVPSPSSTQTEVQHTLPSPILSSPVTGTGPSGWGSITEHILEYILSALRDEQGRWPSRKVRPCILNAVVCICTRWAWEEASGATEVRGLASPEGRSLPRRSLHVCDCLQYSCEDTVGPKTVETVRRGEHSCLVAGAAQEPCR